MKAVTYQDVGDFRVTDSPDPKIQSPTDVILKTTRCSICGSDLHIYHGKVPGMERGNVCGHEYTGIVEEVGAHVTTLKKGQRVVGAFHVACGVCGPCRRGDNHQCRRGGVLGYGSAFGNLPGTQADYARIPYAEINLRKIPDAISDEQALFCGDVLTTAYGALRNANLRPGQTVAVIGCGPVGLMVVQSALAQGAAQVFAIDLLKDRTAAAAAIGAVPIASGETDPIERVSELTGGEGADVVIEAVGGPTTVGLAFRLVRGGGHICVVGITDVKYFEFPMLVGLARDITFRVGVANIHRDIDATLKLVAAGRIDPTVIISHRLPLSDAAEGYRLFDQREASKVVLIPEGAN
jgi:threonine dehydrogenase-like Zn-dependent dehydrogenase